MSMQNISQETQNEIIETFSYLDDWMDRYQYIIDLGNTLTPMDKKFQIPENKVDGCQSQVWIYVERQEDTLSFTATSDSVIVKGLIFLLLRVYNYRTPREILTIEPTYITAIGLDSHLSLSRRNGLSSMLNKIMEIAKIEMLKS